MMGLHLSFIQLAGKDRSLVALGSSYRDCGGCELCVGAGEACNLLTVHFTAPKDKPRTSCFWLIQPKIRIGAQARVETADNLAQNKPSGLE